MYMPTNIEIIISNLLIDYGINSRWKLNILDISNAFNIYVTYENTRDALLIGKDEIYIVINENHSEQEKYVRFLHELSHYLLEHVSIHELQMHQYKYYEFKANNLVQYIAMPYFLIDDIYSLKTVEGVANYFCLPQKLVRKRLEGIKNRTEVFMWQQSYKGIEPRVRYLS